MARTATKKPSRKSKPSKTPAKVKKPTKGSRPGVKAAPKSKPAPKARVAASRPSKPAPAPRPAPKAKPRKKLAVDSHPSYQRLIETLKPGRYARGLVFITEPGALDEEMTDWLMGNVDGRRSLGRTAFGEILVFRDLRARAAELGLGDPERESDVALIDIHYKKMRVLSQNVEGFLDALEDPEFQSTFLRKELYEAVRAKVGPPSETECYGFVPALALGGREDVGSVQRLDWKVHQAILIQT
ncbi:MAG: DUF1851 domain-containing protein [Myxococcaceae bacterium]|jgi:hypothetical protein|nr:DUF1851 domain-containing protein [Myxococcaceae bacterium]